LNAAPWEPSAEDPSQADIARKADTAPVKNRPTGGPLPPRWPRGVIGVAALSILAIVVSTVAIVLTLTHSSASDQSACRTQAWNALPDPTGLPVGWALTAGNFYVDGAGTSAVGPTPSGGTSDTPTVYLQVTCYGSDGHLAMIRLRDSALAVGGTAQTFTSLGDESFAVRDATGGQSVYVRRGQLVAGLAAASSVGLADLETVAQAVDTSLASAASGAQVAIGQSTIPPGGVPVGGLPSNPPVNSAAPSGAPSDAPSGGASGAPSDAPSAAVHVAPDLEALLPKVIGGVTLSSQSTSGTDALGQDASSLALVTSLTQMGKNASDLQIAESYDPAGNLDVELLAFRVPGVDSAKLGQAVLDSWLAGGASGVTTAKVTLSGKAITTVTYSDGGPADYIYEKGDVVYDLSTSDATIAAQTVSLFP
jgi:hypothetical protein